MNKLVLSRFYRASALLSLLISSALAAAPTEVGVITTTNNTKVQLTPCYAKDLPDRLLCGSLQQPLNARAVNDAAQQTIMIHFAIIPAIKPLYPTEAVLAFAGGPGQSAFDAAAVFAQALRYARESRDILLVDQRGTGKSGIIAMRWHGFDQPICV